MLGEISEFCLLIHQYLTAVQSYKEILFNDPTITDHIVWQFVNHSVSQLKLSPNKLYTFLNKNVGILDAHNRNKIILQMIDCQRLCCRYSEYCDGNIGKKQLWGMIRPLHMAHIDSIMAMRNNRNKLSQCPAINFRTKDALISILLQLIKFQRLAQKMRGNIHKKYQQIKAGEINENIFYLNKIDAEHLQAYISEYTTELKIAQCQQIIEHILGYKCQNIDKKFYTYFLPNYHHQKSISRMKNNPNQKYIVQTIRNSNSSVKFKWIETDKYQHYQQSTKKWVYGKYPHKNNKPLYLN